MPPSDSTISRAYNWSEAARERATTGWTLAPCDGRIGAMRTPRALLLLVCFALTVTFSLGACAQSDPEVATLADGPSSAAGDPRDLVGVAEQMCDCLREVNLPVLFEAGPDGRRTLIAFDESRWVIWSFGDGVLNSTNLVTAEELAWYSDRHEYTTSPGPGETQPQRSERLLVVDGTELTEVWGNALMRAAMTRAPLGKHLTLTRWRRAWMPLWLKHRMNGQRALAGMASRR